MAVLPDDKFYNNSAKINKETAIKLKQQRKFNLASQDGQPTGRIIANRYQSANYNVMYHNNGEDSRIPEDEKEINKKNYIFSEQYENTCQFIDSSYVE